MTQLLLPRSTTRRHRLRPRCSPSSSQVGDRCAARPLEALRTAPILEPQPLRLPQDRLLSEGRQLQWAAGEKSPQGVS